MKTRQEVLREELNDRTGEDGRKAGGGGGWGRG